MEGIGSMVQACVLHSSEGWSWTKELVDTLREWERRNLEVVEARNCGDRDQFGALAG